MKIDKEKFYKLKQLDRIEYRQRSKEIEDKYSYPISWNLIFGMIILGLLIMLLGLNIFDVSLANIDGGENKGVEWGEGVMVKLFSMAGLIFKLTFIVLVIEILISFVSATVGIKKLKELEEEYFSVEVKK